MAIFASGASSQPEVIIGLAVGAYGIATAVFNGASSLGQANLGAAATAANCGTSNAGGFTLGAKGNNSAFGNIQVLEILCFASAHDATQRARVIQYCAGRHGIAL